MTEQIFQLKPVVEAPSSLYDAPWPIRKTGEHFIKLSGKVDQIEIGSVMWQLVVYNNKIDEEVTKRLSQSIPTALNHILEDDSLVLPGGLQACLGNVVISPSCCCGLEEWRQWFDLLGSGSGGPWLGHDPDPVVLRKNDVIQIWSDYPGNEGPAESAYCIETTTVELRNALAIAFTNMVDFVTLLPDWAEKLGYDSGQSIADKFSETFDLSSELKSH